MLRIYKMQQLLNVKEFATDGHGQAVAFSPFSPTVFACATGSNYGLSGKSVF